MMLRPARSAKFIREQPAGADDLSTGPPLITLDTLRPLWQLRLAYASGERDRVAKVLIMEFDGDVQGYERVTERLGIDVASGEGDWPAGLLFHSGGVKPGGWIVSEVCLAGVPRTLHG